MRKKLYHIMNRIYGTVMFIAFFGGILPLIPFLFALAIGGSTGESIALWLYNSYYPIIIGLASIAVIIGLITMYIGRESALSTKSFKKGK